MGKKRILAANSRLRIYTCNNVYAYIDCEKPISSSRHISSWVSLLRIIPKYKYRSHWFHLRAASILQFLHSIDWLWYLNPAHKMQNCGTFVRSLGGLGIMNHSPFNKQKSKTTSLPLWECATKWTTHQRMSFMRKWFPRANLPSSTYTTNSSQVVWL